MKTKKPECISSESIEDDELLMKQIKEVMYPKNRFRIKTLSSVRGVFNDLYDKFEVTLEAQTKSSQINITIAENEGLPVYILSECEINHIIESARDFFIEKQKATQFIKQINNKKEDAV
jgi:hypothetical protein